MVVSYFITGSIKVGMAIGGFEVFTKMVLYYFHERVWFRYISLGRSTTATSQSPVSSSKFQVSSTKEAIGSKELDTSGKLPETRNQRQETNYKIVASRSHNNELTETFIEEKRNIHGDVELVPMGSSLKICLVAEGKAHVYPRLGPTMEWDTAAAHAIALAAGCTVLEYETNQPLMYNKENLLNPFFIVASGN